MNDNRDLHLRQPVVAAFGEWSETNIGDHAIHEGVLHFFAECGWRVRCYDFGALRPSAGPRPGVTADRAPDAFDLRASLAAVPAAKRLVRGWRQQFLIKRLLPQLVQCDAICVGGGALLMDSNLHFPQSLAALTWAARRLRKPLLCLGCSAEGHWSWRGRGIVREFVDLCDFIAVRDRASARRIAQLAQREVPVFGDFALAPGLVQPPEAAGRRYLLAVNVSHVPAAQGDLQQRYEDGVVRLVQRVLERVPGAKAALFTTGTAQDLAPAARVLGRLAASGVELHPGRSLDQLRGLMRDSCAVVATRLHAAIIGLAQGVPVIGYSATPKLGNFFDTLDLGRHSFTVDDALARVVAELQRLLRAGPQLPTPACAAIEQTRRAARRFLEQVAQHSYLPEAAGL